MSQESAATESPSSAAAVNEAPVAGRGTRIGAAVIATLIVGSLVLYVLGDRLTPHTSQARVQAFVVPVAPEVSGKVLKVHVRNDQEVDVEQALFDVDPEPYEIAVQRARSDYESVRRSVNASVAGVEAAGLVVTKKEGRFKFHYIRTTPLEEIAKRWPSKTNPEEGT